MLFSVPHIRGHTMPTCPLTGNVNLGHLVMLVSAGFSTLKTPCFFFVINYYSVGRYSPVYANILVLISPLATTLSLLNQPLLSWFPSVCLH